VDILRDRNEKAALGEPRLQFRSLEVSTDGNEDREPVGQGSTHSYDQRCLV
jgi:hypothetical protein